MRVLLDECLPRKLGLLLTGHEVTTVQRAGWAGIVNGRLLALIAGNYAAFITVDKNIPAQQNTAALPFGIVIVRCSTNQLADLKPLLPQVLTALANLRPGQVVIVSV
jgi:predicted nuclease of predicted toxin-antitoxin system